MNDVKVFRNDEFGDIRTIVVDGIMYFIASDIAKALGYADPMGAVKKHCRWVSKKRIPHPQSPVKEIEVNVIPEGDMYRLIMKSQLQSAERFEMWVCDEVLPEIRKTGNYIAKEKPDSYTIENPAERARRWAEEYEERIALEKRVGELEPKAYVCDKLLDSKLLVNFRDAAKEIGISQTQFTGWLKDNRYVYANAAGELRPMERYVACGLFEMKPYQNPHSGYCGSRTLLTPHGLAAFKLLLDTRGEDRNTMRKHGGRKKGTRKEHADKAER